MTVGHPCQRLSKINIPVLIDPGVAFGAVDAADGPRGRAVRLLLPLPLRAAASGRLVDESKADLLAVLLGMPVDPD